MKVGTDCPLCKSDFKMAARSDANYRENIEENRGSGPNHSQHAVLAQFAAAAPPYSRDLFDSDGHEPPAMPLSPLSSRPIRYAANRVIGRDLADSNLASSSGDAFPASPPRNRRSSRRSSAADIYDAPAQDSAPIRDLARVVARRSSAADIHDAAADVHALIPEVAPDVAVRPNRIRLPGLQARLSGGDASSPPVVANDVNGTARASSATSALSGGVRGLAPSRGAQGIQEESPRANLQAPSAAYNTGPLDQLRPRRDDSNPRARNRMDQA